jgi:hypothetical protein
MCEVLRRNISDFYVNLRVEVGKHPQVILAMYLPPLEFDECYSHHFLDMIMQNKKMHVKEIYVIFIHLFDSGILLIIDLNKKKGKKGEGWGGAEFYLFILQLNKCYVSTV